MHSENRDKTYETPKLTHFGSLYDLTASGTGSKAENPGNDTKNPTRIRP
jgi:hypothetical protein